MTNQTSPLAGFLPSRWRHLLHLPSSDPALPGSQAPSPLGKEGLFQGPGPHGDWDVD